MVEGIIVKAISGFYYVKTENDMFECKARGVFRKKATTPLVGDRVEIEVLDEVKKVGNVIKVKDRENYLIRPPIANITKVLVVMSVRLPDPILVFLDKQLAFLEREGIETVICVNKVDLDDTDFAESVKKTYENIGYKVILAEAKNDIGIDAIREELKNEIVVLLGNSGVGKSSITNKIMNKTIMEEGSISKIERGKQTTRHTELLEFDKDSYIADSPGFSSFDISNIESDELDRYFKDFKRHIEECKYRDCNHINEDDCGVKIAVENGLIDDGRYKRYCEIYKELHEKEGRRY